MRVKETDSMNMVAAVSTNVFYHLGTRKSTNTLNFGSLGNNFPEHHIIALCQGTIVHSKIQVTKMYTASTMYAVQTFCRFF